MKTTRLLLTSLTFISLITMSLAQIKPAGLPALKHKMGAPNRSSHLDLPGIKHAGPVYNKINQASLNSQSSANARLSMIIIQDPPVNILDSSYTWSLDTLNHQWNNKNREINLTYDSNHNLTNEARQIWSGTEWENLEQFHYSYNANSDLTDEVYQNGSGNGWVTNSQYLYTYNSSNRITSEIVQSWTGSAWVNFSQNIYTYEMDGTTMTSNTYQSWSYGTWKNGVKYAFTYDASNHCTNYIIQDWVNSQWVNSMQNVYTYNANNYVVSDVNQNWRNSAWKNASQYLYTYNASNKNTIALYQITSGNSWVNSSQYLNTYNAQNDTTISLFQYWTGTAWLNDGQSLYSYSPSHKKTINLFQYWTGSAWLNQAQNLYTYDSHNNMIDNLTQKWTGNDWENAQDQSYTFDIHNNNLSYVWKSFINMFGRQLVADSTYNYYTFGVNNGNRISNGITTGISALTEANAMVSVFPNPSNGQMTVKLSGNGYTLLKISDLLGREAFTQIISPDQNDASLNINIAGVSHGIYLMQIATPDQVISKRLVVQ